MVFTPSKYQLGIFEWVSSNIDTGKHLVVEAVAGSGKTTTAMHVLDIIPSNKEVIYLAFNKHIATELQSKIPAYAEARTYHSLGLSILRDNYGKTLKVDSDKNNGILQTLLNKYEYGYLYAPIKRLAALCKNNLLDATYDNIMDLSLLHNVEINGDIDLVVETVADLLYKAKMSAKIVDFDDMCWIPVIQHLPSKKYDVVIVDELQDTNATQIELALMSVSKNGMIIGVGDSKQSIYGFRGADVNAIPNLINRLQADSLPLSITYRNPQSIVDLVNAKFPNIAFEGRKNAPAGIVKNISGDMLIELAEVGDMILCRTNAPLVEYCFEFIRRGIKATIRGRDIGKGLTTLIKKFKKQTNVLVDLLYLMSEYRDLETAKMVASNKTGAAIALADKVNTVVALADGCTSISEVEQRIETIFSDDNPGILLSSIHKAKGLEAERVFILHPELLPHPLAKQAWEQEQEKNIEYVAYTRSLKELYIVQENYYPSPEEEAEFIDETLGEAYIYD